jgi:hypothetical protein
MRRKIRANPLYSAPPLETVLNLNVLLASCTWKETVAQTAGMSMFGSAVMGTHTPEIVTVFTNFGDRASRSRWW